MSRIFFSIFTGMALSIASASVFASPKDQCGEDFDKFRAFFDSESIAKAAYQVYEKEISDGFDHALKEKKIAPLKRRQYQARLLGLVAAELPAAIRKEDGLLDKFACTYSLHAPNVDLVELRETLELTSSEPALGLGTQWMQWTAITWCAKEFWPKFYKIHQANRAGGEPPIEFRPILWC